MANGSTVLSQIDGRSAEARRFRDIVINLASDLGGLAELSEHDAALVRHAAALTMQSEVMQRAAVRGEAVDTEQLVRITNALTRTLSAVNARRKPKRAPGLADILARHAHPREAE